MKQTEKLDSLIKKIIKEELGNIKNISEDSKKKLYQNPELEDEDSIHYLGSDNEHDYYYDETGGHDGGTFLAQFDDGVGQHQSGFHIAYSKRLGLNKALKMAHDQKLLTAKDKKTLKQIELERRKQGVIKDGDGIFTLPDDIKEEEREFITADGTSKTVTPEQRAQISRFKAGDTIKYKKQGMAKESEEMQAADTEVLENEVKASDIAGQVSEIVDKLKTMAEAKEDPKKQKLAAKAMKQMESAKAALEALTAHEMMLEEKEKEAEKKDAEKHVKGFKKHLTKLVKEPAAVEKIASKMTPEKMADLKKKLKSGELDEEKLARVMLQHSLKEGWIK